VTKHESEANRASASAQTAGSRMPSLTRTRASEQRDDLPRRQAGKCGHELYFIRDGIVIIPKNGVIPHGTVIEPARKPTAS